MLLDILFFLRDNKKIRIPTMPCQNSHRVVITRGESSPNLKYVRTQSRARTGTPCGIGV